MTALGKIVGGGMPLAAYGGRRDVMEKIAPLGPVYQAGTLSGNPIATSAALATLERLDDALYVKLESLGARLEAGFRAAAKKRNAKMCVQRVGSMLTPFFTEGPVRSWPDAKACDTERFGKWHRGMRENGVYWPPSQFEAAFISGAHTEADIDATIRACEAALA
jgi:glutamate-1-semialdehyde 2,1-aminomutase